MRWIVGDIQGCVEPFERLLKKIRFDTRSDELWSAGDLVNRGPESLETMRLWRSIEGKGVLGNHDIHAIETHAGQRSPAKNPTLAALLAAPDAGGLIDSLRSLPLIVRLSSDEGLGCWLVHAGIHPAWYELETVARKINAAPHDPAWLRSPATAFATRARCCTKEGELGPGSGPPEACRKPFAPWDAYYRGSDRIVHGHWARRGFYRGERTLGLDSGCVYGGKLTAWSVEEDRIVQVDGQRG